MSNPCEGCPTNCCSHFGITKELGDPSQYDQYLIDFPYIHQIDTTYYYYQDRKRRNHKRMVHIHSCDRFNIETGECRNHDTQPRPPFCINSGNIIDLRPKDKCLFFPPLKPKPPSNQT